MINEYPYTDFNEYNMDWIIKTVGELTLEWKELKADWVTMEEDFEDLKKYVQDYFDNLDVSAEIDAKIDELINDGYFEDLFNQLFRSTLITESAVLVSDWISNNLTQDPGYVIDTSLLVSNAAADALAAGILIRENEDDIYGIQNNFSYFFRYTGFANGSLSNGVPNTSVLFRIYTTDMIQLPYDIIITPSATFKFGVQTFVGGVFNADSGWKQVAYKVPANTEFKLVIARRTENVSETADIEVFSRQVTFQTIPEQVIDTVKPHFYQVVTDIPDELFEQGSLGNSGEDDTYGATASARTRWLMAPDDIYITANVTDYSLARVAVHYFDMSKTWLSSSGWQARVIIPKGSVFRVLLRKVYNSTSPVSVSDILACFSIEHVFKLNNFRPCKVISHQGNVNGSSNYCKVEGYEAAGLAGFDFGECDIKFTSDGVPVCCHDATFVDGGSGTTITIASTPLATLKTYDYYGGTIATLEEVLRVCKKYGMGLYIDQYSQYWGDSEYNAIFAAINKYKMAEYCRHIIYYAVSASYILARHKEAFLVCGQDYGSVTADDAVNLADAVNTDYNKIEVCLSINLGSPVILAASQSMNPKYDLNLYTIDTLANNVNYSPICSSFTTNMGPEIYL